MRTLYANEKYKDIIHKGNSNTILIALTIDLDKGIYSNFPKLERKLKGVKAKLTSLNANLLNIEFTSLEINLLIENEYVRVLNSREFDNIKLPIY